MDGWWAGLIMFFAVGWFLRSLGQSRGAQISELRNSVRELARLTLSMDKRLSKLEGREPSDDTADDEFYRRLDL